MFETIVALATPSLKSALAIIRLSGGDAFNIVNQIFTKDILKNKKRDIHFGYIKDDEKTIDQVVVLTYVAPHSFTGEDCLEIICHGSMVIANEIINLLISKGARYATNGEFSSRAFLNNKIDLVQAEAINDMINASTSEAKDLSLLALKGENSKLFIPIQKKIADLLSQLEVNIDFPEYEDIEEISKEEVIKYAQEIIDELEPLIKKGEHDKIYREGVKIALVGKPNVGKSSLLNALISEEKAIVTPIAGTTRDIVEGECNIGGILFRFFDTAGVHESNDLIEQIGINKALDTIKNCDLVIYIVDEDKYDEEMLNLIKDKKHIIVHNKMDLTNTRNKNEIYVSALNKNINSLIEEIKKVMEIDEINIKPSFNNSRQIGLLKAIVINLKQALNDAKEGLSTDLISASILLAYNASLDLLGKNNKNDLTDEIFSRFCVGK
ncbi:MAG: tRNA uridine-5-carboxymethylaminomethyl(34) synthesis GTPase MnmE [Bacilli bacterium]|nr:tRNA uridine-5-carboxymethylaminomethyl(34) synthesis GTPase MnmE [Bacilli bacterium]